MVGAAPPTPPPCNDPDRLVYDAEKNEWSCVHLADPRYLATDCYMGGEPMALVTYKGQNFCMKLADVQAGKKPCDAFSGNAVCVDEQQQTLLDVALVVGGLVLFGGLYWAVTHRSE
jgi:hypothetical protein